jgi:GT2 family glycosyltransferase
MEWINNCLSSLRNSEYPVRTIVFDNSSTDGTCAFIENHFQHVQLIRSSKNLGFGRANNAAIYEALQHGADCIFLLNQDAWVKKDTLSILMRAHQENRGYGIISPVHLNGSGSGPDANFLQYFRKSELAEWMSSVLLKTPIHNALIRTEFVNAAAWLLTADCIRKTGGFDPFFFHYGEDVNYCQRILYQGYQIGIHTDAVIYHDREVRLAIRPSPNNLFKREWINLANYLCDVRQKKFPVLFIKRLLRYLWNAAIAALTLNLASLRFNVLMITKMLQSVSAIRKSRKSAHLHQTI